MPNPPQTPDEQERNERAEALAEKVKQEARAVTGRIEKRAEALEEQRAGQAEVLEAQRAGQAEALEEQRAGQAEALEEQRADQATALEERRIEHRIEERREQQADLKTELHGIVEAIATLIQHMDQSLPEERLKQLADAVLAEERLGRKRLTTKITGFLVVIMLLVVSSLWQSASNGRTLDEAKTVADYVRNCLQHPQELTPEQRMLFCGPTPAGTTNFIKYLNCALLINPDARTDENLNTCARQAFGG